MIPTHIPKAYEKTEKGRILRGKNKHDDPMWMAETKEQFLAAFLRLFQTNDQCEYYHDLATPDEDSKKEIAELETQVAALKDNPILKKQYDETVKKLAEAKRWQPDTREIELYKAAKEGNAYAAYHLCCSRQDAEYEGFEITNAADPLEKETAGKE